MPEHLTLRFLRFCLYDYYEELVIFSLIFLTLLFYVYRIFIEIHNKVRNNMKPAADY